MTWGNGLRLAALVVVVAIVTVLLRGPGNSADVSSARTNEPMQTSSLLQRERSGTAAPHRDSVAATPKTTGTVDHPAGAEVPAAPEQPLTPPSLPSAPSQNAGTVAKPIPLLKGVEEVFEKSQSPNLQESLEHQRSMQQEPENEWSQEMEARLQKYVAAQPEAQRVDVQISCRAEECMIQMADRVQEPLVNGRAQSPSQAVFYRMQNEPWFQQDLRHVQTQLVPIDKRPYWLGFFDKR